MESKETITSINGKFQAVYQRQFHEFEISASGTVGGRPVVIGRLITDASCKEHKFLMGTAEGVVGITINEMAELRRLCMDAGISLARGTGAFVPIQAQSV